MNRVASYTVGLALALILTIAAFSLVFERTQASLIKQPPAILIPAILVLAMIQLVVQLVFFLHLGQSKESRWNTAMFAFTFTGVLVVVVASIWIMDHLNYNMTPTEINQYVTDQSTF